MEPWRQELGRSLVDPARIAERYGLDPAMVARVADRFPVRITPHVADLIRDPRDPLGRQFLPDPSELDEDGLAEDPLSEDALSPVPALIHRYPKRVLLLAGNSCAAYCRFCTRRRRVGCRGRSLTFGEVEEGIAYIADHPEIDEVVISGGDPLLLADPLLEQLLRSLRRIPHLGLLRLATRTPAVLPARITPGLCALLARFQPLFVTTHFNHPAELVAESAAACGRLADAGIPLANQSVLLRGINDDLSTLADLCNGLLRLRVRPYYLHHLDPVRGASRFAVSLRRGLELIQELWVQVSGLAVPHYVIDTPGGKGKVPVLPRFLHREDGQVVVYTPAGERVVLDEG